MKKKQTQIAPHNSNPSHEAISINGSIAIACAVSLLAIMGLALFVSSGLHRWLAPKSAAHAITQQPVARSVPTVGLNPQQQKTRSQYDTQQQERLSSYGWVDREKGEVHIPINRAMAILVEQNRRAK